MTTQLARWAFLRINEPKHVGFKIRMDPLMATTL